MNEKIELQGDELLCTKNVSCEVLTKADDNGSPIIARVSTASVDSDGDIIHQGKNKRGAGWMLERFNRAPVVVWSHDLWMPNLADPKTKAKLGPDETFGRSLFLNPLVFDGGDEFAMALDGKYRRGVLKEFSVSFIGQIHDKIIDQESNRPTGIEFFQQELVETSPVNRGANPDTDAIAKRMLGSAYISRKIQDAGDPEVIEAKEAIADIHAQLEILTAAVKAMGNFQEAQEEEASRLGEKIQNRQLQLDAVASDTLGRLRKIGTAAR